MSWLEGAGETHFDIVGNCEFDYAPQNTWDEAYPPKQETHLPTSVFQVRTDELLVSGSNGYLLVGVSHLTPIGCWLVFGKK